jgi:hypothetical protein
MFSARLPRVPFPRRLVAVLTAGAFAATLTSTVLLAAPAPAFAACPVNSSCGVPTPPKPPAGTPPKAAFNWNAASRSAGANDTSDIDALTAYINSPFLLDLNGCGSAAGAAPISSYRWSLNGAVANGCTVAWSVAKQGSYPVSLTVTDSAGLSSTTTQTVTVKDYFVVALGDSIASGEGNPATPERWNLPPVAPVWPNTRCHRSPLAPSQQAMSSFEASHPHESVTYVNLACSGASIPNILQDKLGGTPYAGIEPDGVGEPPQLDALDTLMANTHRSPDAVMLSIGANDFGFANLVQNCAQISSFWETTSECSAALYNDVLQGTANLLGGYAGFAGSRYAQLAQGFKLAGIAPSRVLISQYPDPTHADNGSLCSTMLADTLIGTIHAPDVAWGNSVVADLNQDVATAAQYNGWQLVSGMASDFGTHGYCANNRWVNTFTDSMYNQGNMDGMLHPNNAGEMDYANHLGQSVTSLSLIS